MIAHLLSAPPYVFALLIVAWLVIAFVLGRKVGRWIEGAERL